jgi:mono/diheme cytochrome c family protein
VTRSILSLDRHQIPVHLSIGSLLTRVVLVRQYCAGGTTISAGTLLLGIGGTTGNIICDVAGNGPLAFGRHAAFALGVWASITGAAAMPADPARGEKLARHWCASCHIVANDQKGGADSAPPFATIARKPGFNAGKIAQFLMDPHPKMPDMQLSRDEAKDLGAYIASLAQ